MAVEANSRQSFLPPGFPSWREEARRCLAAGVPPSEVTWAGPALSFDPARRDSGREPPRVAREYLRLAVAVACHRDPTRWDLLYRLLWRITRDEPKLLRVATDPDVHRALVLEKAVRRASHKMKAFVRFRRTAGVAPDDERYVAWFEPAHYIVERTTPFFVRRFTAMQWSILTPDRCVHWDGREVVFTDGVAGLASPASDPLEDLWRDYYASVFNPARLMPRAMRAEMPKSYWRNLPEARLIPELTRAAPARLMEMLARVARAPLPLPEDLRAAGPIPSAPPRRLPPARQRSGLDIPSWDSVHDPGPSVARTRELAAPQGSGRAVTSGEVSILPGVAGWTDPSLLAPGVFYPDDATTPEARLRYYAARYAMVEVDATYYAMPRREHAVAWAARTPAGFVFNIKANALMTGHAADLRRLPDWLRRTLPRRARDSARIYGSNVPDGVMDEVWRRFLSALEPLVAAGKLGAIFLQFPRWFEPGERAERWLADAARRLGDVRGAVEFRNPGWVAPDARAERTFALLESLGLAYTIVDAPQGTRSSMPPLVRVTRPDFAVVRLHGRRVATWEARNEVVTERYRYLYDRSELAFWADRVRDVALQLRTGTVQLSFNNNHSNYATTNAVECGAMLRSLVAGQEQPSTHSTSGIFPPR